MLLLRSIKDNYQYFYIYIHGKSFYEYLSIIKKLPSSKWLKKKRVWQLNIYDYDLLVQDCRAQNLTSIELDPTLTGLISQFRSYKARFEEIAAKTETDFFIDESFLKMPLSPYQKVMVEFFYKRKRGLNGSEMGVGKTFPSLVTGELLRREGLSKNCIIICPSAVKYNWANELNKFFKEPSYLIIEGPPDLREQMYYDESIYFKIVNYEIFRNDWENILEGGISYDCVILDEIHRIRNYKTKQATAIFGVGDKASFRYGISGTPVHNQLKDLHSILRFIHKDLLGDWYRFSNRYLQKDYFGQTVGYYRLNEIHEKLRFVMIRKTKDEVMKDLPPKTYKDIYVDLTPIQKNLYKSKLKEAITDEDGNYCPGEHLTRQIYLREICDTTELVSDCKPSSSKIDEIKAVIDELIANDQKVVVFSQWKRMVKILQREIKHQSIILTGDIDSKDGKREILQKEFHESKDKNVFIMTTAGSEGINLQCASYMILVDLPFNPQVINQLEDRLHRKGQTKNVTIIKIIAKDTIEDMVLEIIKEKQKLATKVVDGEAEYEIRVTKEMLEKALNDWDEKNK